MSAATETAARLRAVRKAKGMSLNAVQRTSEGRLKASILGAYERCERPLTLTRLATLAEFYEVPLAVLLGVDRAEPADDERRLCFVLDTLRAGVGPQGRLWSFVHAIAERRGDYSGGAVALRGDDLPAVMALIGAETPEAAFVQLDAWGVLAAPEAGL